MNKHENIRVNNKCIILNFNIQIIFSPERRKIDLLKIMK